MQRAVHERLVFELLGIRERFSNSTTRKALDAYQEHRPQPPGEQDSAPMHKAPVRCACPSCHVNLQPFALRGDLHQEDQALSLLAFST